MMRLSTVRRTVSRGRLWAIMSALLLLTAVPVMAKEAAQGLPIQKGQVEDMIARYQAAVRINPENVDAHYNLGY